MIHPIFQIIIAVIVRSFILFFNCVGYVLEALTHKKLKIEPSKQVVVITGCDSGFGEL